MKNFILLTIDVLRKGVMLNLSFDYCISRNGGVFVQPKVY